jgi:sugar O-acyltransferase (sialic acid O-acetyltransferase NeuD family)
MRIRRNRILIWGAGGHGKVTADAVLASGEYDIVGFIDDDLQKTGWQLLGLPVLDFAGGLAELVQRVDFDAVNVAIGDNYTRYEKYQMLRRFGLEPASVIHPRAHISRFVEVGQGVVVLAHATITPGTVIEDFSCVNTAASVDHDNHLGTACHVMPKATLTGTVEVGDFAYVGAGSVVKQNLAIGKYSYIGAGAVVVKDVAEGVIVRGVPAIEAGKQIKRPEGDRHLVVVAGRSVER